jgi:hypothetical protein
VLVISRDPVETPDLDDALYRGRPSPIGGGAGRRPASFAEVSWLLTFCSLDQGLALGLAEVGEME